MHFERGKAALVAGVGESLFASCSHTAKANCVSAKKLLRAGRRPLDRLLLRYTQAGRRRRPMQNKAQQQQLLFLPSLLIFLPLANRSLKFAVRRLVQKSARVCPAAPAESCKKSILASNLFIRDN